MSITWFNGHFVDHLTIDPAERGLMLGDGIFETVAVHGSKPIWLDDHLARMESAAAELGLSFNLADIQFAVAAIAKKSSVLTEVLRITLTRGPTPRGLATDGAKQGLFLTLAPFDSGKLPSSVRLATSAIKRNETSPASRLKTLSYIDSIAAAREVTAHADDALMLNTSGHVASTTVANIFLLRDQNLITPNLNQAILPGVTRAKLIAGAARLGLKAKATLVKAADLFRADAVFLTNSLRLAVPVISIDDKPCGTRDISKIKSFLERSDS